MNPNSIIPKSSRKTTGRTMAASTSVAPRPSVPTRTRSREVRVRHASPAERARFDVGTRRTVILVAALVIAAVAGVATFSYLSGVQSRANKGATLVKVFVVKKDIAKGFPA